MGNVASVLPKADFYLIPDYVTDTKDTFEYLKNNINWSYYEGDSGRMHCTMRLDFFLLGGLFKAQEFDPVVLRIMNKLNTDYSLAMNSCYANYYPDASATLPFNRDVELQEDHNQPVTCVTYGGSRLFTFIDIDTTEEFNCELSDGSLWIKCYNCNDRYIHGIRSSDEYAAPRISLSFRRLSGW